MASCEFIPAGRTSMVTKGDVHLQVQTEYAHRPVPRITTTILNNGQVLNKIERTLERAVASLEDQARVETTIKRQHLEVIEIIQDRKDQEPAKNKAEPKEVSKTARQQEDETRERLSAIPGVQRVYSLDNDGNFYSDSGSEEFRQLFGPVFRNIRELMEVFSKLPGVSFTRESGVYEVERDRLYLGSTGSDCFFVVVRRVNVTTNYEKEIKTALHVGSLN